DAISRSFAEAAQLIQVGHQAATLIGSHGQTVYHLPRQEAGELGYSLQLGRGSLIAHLTGITTVSNFRSADIAIGGHGAPLVPRVDAYLLGDYREERCIQNIGGIGNVTY
ncbi:MAG: anhydro-N-acetylmuramic acid kinase, partial [Dolichospermum sp.]